MRIKAKMLSLLIFVLLSTVFLSGCLQSYHTQVSITEIIPPFHNISPYEVTIMEGDPIFFHGEGVSGIWQFMYSYPNIEEHDIVSWFWDFGDGYTSSKQNPEPHIYNKSGEYILTLTATSEKGVPGMGRMHVKVVPKNHIYLDVNQSIEYNNLRYTSYYSIENSTYSEKKIHIRVEYELIDYNKSAGIFLCIFLNHGTDYFYRCYELYVTRYLNINFNKYLHDSYFFIPVNKTYDFQYYFYDIDCEVKFIVEAVT